MPHSFNVDHDPGAIPPLLEEVIAAHGGRERWERVRTLECRMRFIGRALAMKFVSPRLRFLHIHADARLLRSVVENFPRAGVRGVFEPDRLWLETNDGVLLDERLIKRDKDGRVPHRKVWDDFDLLYFFGYVALNYLFAPYLFLLPGFETREVAPWRAADGSIWRGLQVRYPPGFPAHCREQTLYFAADGLLRRLDYTAEPLSRFARGAHYTEQHKTFAGLTFPTHRRVFVRGPGGRPLRGLAVMEGWIDAITVHWQAPQSFPTDPPIDQEIYA